MTSTNWFLVLFCKIQTCRKKGATTSASSTQYLWIARINVKSLQKLWHPAQFACGLVVAHECYVYIFSTTLLVEQGWIQFISLCPPTIAHSGWPFHTKWGHKCKQGAMCMRARPSERLDSYGCAYGSVCGHMAHDVCGPGWNTRYGIWRRHWTYGWVGPMRTLDPLKGVYVKPGPI